MDREWAAKHQLVRITPKVTLPEGSEIYKGVVNGDQPALFLKMGEYWGSVLIGQNDDEEAMAEDIAMLVDQLKMAEDYRNGKIGHGKRESSVVQALHG